METNKILHSGKIFAASLLAILAVSCAPSNFTSVVTEADNSTAGHPHQPALTLAPPVRVVPDISSFAYMVIDPYSNSIILQHNADAALAPASLAKLMTAYVVAEHLNVTRADLQTEVTVSRRAQSLGGSSMFLQRNLPVTLDQLLFGLIVSSGNDAAVALAEHVAESEEEFVELMNRQVQDLGLKNCVSATAMAWTTPKCSALSGTLHGSAKCSSSSTLIFTKDTSAGATSLTTISSRTTATACSITSPARWMASRPAKQAAPVPT